MCSFLMSPTPYIWTHVLVITWVDMMATAMDGDAPSPVPQFELEGHTNSLFYVIFQSEILFNFSSMVLKTQSWLLH